MPYLGMQKSSTPRASKSPSIKDLHWATGILEGEAFFGKQGTRFTESVTVSMTDKEPLDKLSSLFGGRVFSKKRPSNPNYKQVYSWGVYGSRARGVMLTLYVLLSPRRKEQIKGALQDV